MSQLSKNIFVFHVDLTFLELQTEMLTKLVVALKIHGQLLITYVT